MKKTIKFASIMMVLALVFCLGTASFAETAAPELTAEAVLATAEPETTEAVAAGTTEEPEVTAVVDEDAGDVTIGTTEEDTSNPVSAPEGVKTAIIVVIVLCALVLIAAVLMQQTKSAGLGGAFGGDTQSFTARGKAASKEAKLQKITLITAIAITVLTILLAILD
ncbi:MAG: preprotein translocase subunit SecG [Clostridia bacterium]|nr:preprotein translocase subunit SecG [Clostridia bacterium]